MTKEIVIKEDWKGEAIKSIMGRVGYGINIDQASQVIKQLTDSVCKIEINHD